MPTIHGAKEALDRVTLAHLVTSWDCDRAITERNAAEQIEERKAAEVRPSLLSSSARWSFALRYQRRRTVTIVNIRATRLRSCTWMIQPSPFEETLTAASVTDCAL